MPNERPKAVSASTELRSAPPVSAPMRQDVAMSAAVLPVMAAKYSSEDRSVRKQERTSSTCPWQSCPSVVARSPAISGPRSAAMAADRDSR